MTFLEIFLWTFRPMGQKKNNNDFFMIFSQGPSGGLDIHVYHVFFQNFFKKQLKGQYTMTFLIIFFK